MSLLLENHQVRIKMRHASAYFLCDKMGRLASLELDGVKGTELYPNGWDFLNNLVFIAGNFKKAVGWISRICAYKGTPWESQMGIYSS